MVLGLEERVLTGIREVLSRHPDVTGAVVYGSRAKGTERAASDIDIALEGIGQPLRAEAVASELEELPYPYKFDVRALSAIRSPALLDHIERVGVRIYG
ncbi:MAG: nucleotidyltransferase domain-containing protein [Candidatus Hydrogenedens sp.]|nr:nucleotidyltransferase domain-containing protein [Candidatus Hydrogenedens sp.]